MAENRGGPRAGKAGSFYPNRSDARQPKTAAQGQEYGQRGAQERRLSQVPLANKASQLPAPQTERAPRDDLTGKIPGMATPSLRPNEPVTAGLPIGPGAGPEALAIASAKNQELSVYRAIYNNYPSEDFRRMIEFIERNL
jgi:hypothetical protein